MTVPATDTWNQIGLEAAKGLMDSLAQTKAFVLEQAPDLAKEIIRYSMVESLI